MSRSYSIFNSHHVRRDCSCIECVQSDERSIRYPDICETQKYTFINGFICCASTSYQLIIFYSFLNLLSFHWLREFNQEIIYFCDLDLFSQWLGKTNLALFEQGCSHVHGIFKCILKCLHSFIPIKYQHDTVCYPVMNNSYRS